MAASASPFITLETSSETFAGGMEKSQSIQTTTSPLASSMPRWIAEVSPRSSTRWISRTSSMSRASRSTTCAVPSGESSSTTSISQGQTMAPRSLRTSGAMFSRSL